MHPTDDQGLICPDLATAHSRVVYDGRSYRLWQITLNFRRIVRPALVRSERFPEGMQPVQNAPYS
jgi:hypothetical protein